MQRTWIVYRRGMRITEESLWYSMTCLIE